MQIILTTLIYLTIFIITFITMDLTMSRLKKMRIGYGEVKSKNLLAEITYNLLIKILKIKHQEKYGKEYFKLGYKMQSHLEDLPTTKYPTFTHNFLKVSGNEEFLTLLKSELLSDKTNKLKTLNATGETLLKLLEIRGVNKKEINNIINDYCSNIDKFHILMGEYEEEREAVRNSLYGGGIAPLLPENEYDGLAKIISEFHNSPMLMSATELYLKEALETVSKKYEGAIDSKNTVKSFNNFSDLICRATKDSIERNTPLEWLYEIEYK